MWNSGKYAGVAIACAGLTVAAATPASAWRPGYGYYDGYGAYVHAGDFDFGWPFNSYGYTEPGRLGTVHQLLPHEEYKSPNSAPGLCGSGVFRSHRTLRGFRTTGH